MKRARISADELRFRQHLKEQREAEAALRGKRFFEMMDNHLTTLSTEATDPRERLLREAHFVYAWGLGFTFALKQMAPIFDRRRY